MLFCTLQAAVVRLKRLQRAVCFKDFRAIRPPGGVGGDGAGDGDGDGEGGGGGGDVGIGSESGSA